jgi:hypothetical protein
VPRRAASVAVLLLALAGAGEAAADPVADAERLFREGRTLLAEGNAAEACDRFERSIEAAPSYGAQANLGLCNAELGRVATAHAAYLEAARMALVLQDPGRVELAMGEARALEPRVPRLVIDMGPRPAGLVVRLDGVALPAAEIETSRALDPGEHRVEATAPGHEPWSTTVSLDEGETETLVVPPLRPPSEPPSPAEPQSSTAMLGAGVVVTGAGALGLAVGIGFGVLALETRDRAAGDPALCFPADRCTRDGLAAIERARVEARIATAAVTLGAVTAAGGIALLVLGTTQPADSAVVPLPYGLGLRQRF